MRHKRLILLAAIIFNLRSSTTDSVSSQSNRFSGNAGQEDTLEEILKTAFRAAVAGDWAGAESEFRQAARLEPKQGLWRIQLLLALGYQKKWKDAFKEFDKVMERGLIDWVLTIDKKMPDGIVAFVDTEMFGDEQQGIRRYVKAVKEKKKVKAVSSDIGVKLDDFAKQHNIALTYDISKFKGMRFESGDTVEMTSDFIAYYNGLYQD